MNQTSVIGAWPLWGDTGLQAILFISSNDPDYFSNKLCLGTGKALFPSLTPRKEATSNTDIPVALLPVLRSAKLRSVLVVRSQLTEYLSEDVAGLLQRVASLLGRGLDEMDLKQKLADEQIRQSWLASHDPLTGLINRRGLETYFFHAILRAQRNRTSLAVLLIDLDDFKPVNDTYGLEAGDRLLVRVAGALQDAIRNTDFLVRLGGDEFVILLEGLHKTDDLLPVMDNIYKAVVTPFMLVDEIKVSVGCSAGLTLYPEDSATPDGLLRHADGALYVAKRNKQSRPPVLGELSGYSGG